MMRKISNRILYKLFSMLEYRRKEFSSTFYLNHLVKRLKKVPKDLSICGKIDVVFPQGLILGDNVHIGENVYLNCRGGLVIGDHSHIERNVSIMTTSPNYDSSAIPFDSKQIPGRIIIGKAVHIGMNVSVMPGVTIGDGAIIGAGSVITSNVESGAVVGMLNKNYDSKRFSGKEGVKLENEIWQNNRSILNKSMGKPVFILSTGRAGSKSIAAFLNQYPEIEAYHELFYDFFKVLSTNYLAGKINRNAVKEEMERLYSSIENFDAQKIFIDSDQKLAPFVDILYEIFPQSKFIWLIRKPDGFLSSARARGWYQNDAPVFNEKTVLIQKEHYSHGTRITGDALKNSERVENWENYSTDDKILWYWFYWNSLINSQLENIPEHRKMVVKLEQLNFKKKELLSFIGAETKESFALKKTNKVKKKHEKNYSATIHSDKINTCMQFYNEIKDDKL